MQMKEAKRDIKLLTYNLFIRPPPVNSFGNDYKDERFDYFVKHYLPLYDIVCIQEMFISDIYFKKLDLIEKAAQLGFKYHAIGTLHPYYSTEPNISDGGLLTLSKFPIIKSEFHRYQNL